MTGAVVCIGRELLRGELIDTNGAWLAERLTTLGYDVRELATVDDHVDQIEQTLRRLQHHALLICTGGLGPTTDDLTRRSVAQLLDVPLVTEERVRAQIEQRYAARGMKMPTINARQAERPEGTELLDNRRGTAPGFRCITAGGQLVCLPGVPHEMKAMFERHVADRMSHSGTRSVQVQLRTYGMTESAVAAALEPLGLEQAEWAANAEGKPAVTVAYRASFPEILVKLLAKGPSISHAQALAERAAQKASDALGDAVYGSGDASLAEVTIAALQKKKLRLAVAESCTGGRIAAAITAVPGSSAVTQGGIVAYANQAKVDLLGVDAELIASHGAVSAAVAKAMAECVLRRLEADVALSVTGISGPGGGSESKPVGTTFLALADRSAETQVEQHVFPWDRARNQQAATWTALNMLRMSLRGGASTHTP